MTDVWATQTSEFGDLVGPAAGSSVPSSIDVVLSRSGCHSGRWNGSPSACVTTHGAAFTTAIALNQKTALLFQASRPGSALPRRYESLGGSQSGPFPAIEDELTATLVTEAEFDYSTFFRAEFAPVLRTVALLLRDQSRAEEITQDAFIQLLRNWPKISRYERPQAWVRRVAIRLAMRAIRRERLWSFVHLELLPSAAAPPSRFDVPGAIHRLPGSQRAAIVLHYYEDRPVAAVATILGCSESTARVHLHRGRKRLRQLLGEDDDVA